MAGTEQKKRDQILVAERFHARIDLGGGIDRGIVPGTPGHSQPHDRSQVGQSLAAGLALQEGAVGGFTDLPGQRNHNRAGWAGPGKTQPGGWAEWSGRTVVCFLFRPAGRPGSVAQPSLRLGWHPGVRPPTFVGAYVPSSRSRCAPAGTRDLSGPVARQTKHGRTPLLAAASPVYVLDSRCAKSRHKKAPGDEAGRRRAGGGSAGA